MIDDCKAGKIGLILTKSISRFARNNGDLLSYINTLSALDPPVEIRFETENESSLGVADELIIMFRGMLAQEESHAKSKNITWAIDKLFEQGKYYTPPVLGFDKEKGRDKPLTINKEEAKTVELCYALTVMGYSFAEIARIMNTLGLKSKRGNVKWNSSGVVALLSNEKNVGDIIARKTVTRSYKTHEVKKNEGEKPQYHEKEHHVPIVPRFVYDEASRIKEYRSGGYSGIPCLKTVSEGALKGFVTVDKTVRNYTLKDYQEASGSLVEEVENSEVSILADKVSAFDFRSGDVVSSLFLDDRMNPACTINSGTIAFNAACRKALGAEKAEILFHPVKAILAVRSPTDKKEEAVALTKSIHLSSFMPVALKSAGLKSENRYRMYGIRRVKNGERILFFDLHDVMIVTDEKDSNVLPDKYAGRFGDGYYENFVAYGLHKIDIDGNWQILHESKPTKDSQTGQITELAEFRRKSLEEFGLSDEVKNG
jgi:DNA invertase Pin-like site-specific DNA recombinase